MAVAEGVRLYGEICIDLPGPRIHFLRDVDKYPFGTLSNEYAATKWDNERRAEKILCVEKLGDGRIPSPAKIIECWFKSFFSDPTNFFCCSSPSRVVFKLCDYLTQSPFYCLFVACVTMSSDGVGLTRKRQSRGHAATQPSTSDLCTSERSRFRHLKTTKSAARQSEQTRPTISTSYSDRSQSIIGICSNPPKWIKHKNRRVINLFIQTLIQKRMMNDETKSTNTSPTNIQPNSESTDSDEELLGKQKHKKRRRVQDHETRENRLAGSMNTNSPLFPHLNGTTLPPNASATPPPAQLRKKMRSSWSLVAYIILDKYSHSPDLINKLSRDTLYSKGINNRIQTLFSIAQKHKVPIWMSQKVMDNMKKDGTTDSMSAML